MIRPHLAAALSQHYPNHAFCVVDDEVTWQDQPPVVDEAAITATETALASAALQKRLEAAVQRHLDAVAITAGYDTILSACSYAAAPNPYQHEAVAFLTWRGAVWAHCYQVLTDAQAGNRMVPTEAELIAELPGRESA